MYKNLLLILLIMALLTGCIASKQVSQNQPEGQVVPDWLVSAMKAEFQNPELVKPDDITMAQLSMPDKTESTTVYYKYNTDSDELIQMENKAMYR